MTKQTKESVLVNATLNWAFFDKVSDMSGKYQVDISNLSEADQVKLQGIGLGPNLNEDDLKAKEKKWKREGKFTPEEIKDKLTTMPDKGVFMTIKSQVKAEKWRNDEADLRWFTVTAGVDQDEIDLSSIGNGTKAIVKVEAVPYNNSFGQGLSAGLAKVRITSLVKYEVASKDEDDEMNAMVQAEVDTAVTAEMSNEGFDLSEA